MRALHIATRIVHILVWVVMSVVLLVTAVLLTVYSSWGQAALKDAVLAKVNSIEGASLEIDHFRLKFPLDLDLDGVALVQQGDTLVKADTLHASVGIMPLLIGNVHISEARLIGGQYTMGAPDSAMYMVIKAQEVLLKPATVSLGPSIDITLDHGELRHALVDLTLNPDTAAKDTTSSSQAMNIILKELALQDFTYRMSMLPTIDSLGTNIRCGTLRDGKIDLEKQTLSLHTFIADTLSVAYIAPDSATIAATPVVPVDTTSSAPWTITIDTIRLENSRALYTTQGVVPLPGLDFAYISAEDMSLTVTDFYNQATTLSLPLAMHATERSGVTLDATGTFAMDSTAMYFRDFDIITSDTHLTATGVMGVGDLLTDPALPLELRVDGFCGIPDLQLMFPDFKPYLSMLSSARRIDLGLDMAGTTGRLDISKIMLALKGYAKIEASGTLDNVFDPARIGGDMALNGRILNISSILHSVVQGDMSIAVPPMTLKGAMHMHRGAMAANLAATTATGRLAFDGHLNTNTEGYDLDLDANDFPLQAFLPDMGLGAATLKFTAKGKGFDIFNVKTQLEANVDIKSFVYEGYDYHDITAKAKIDDGQAVVEGGVDTHDVTANFEACGNLKGDTYDWNVTVDGESIDLYALKLSETPMYISGKIEADAEYTPDSGKIEATVHVPGIYYKGAEENEISITNVTARFYADDSLTRINLHNRDLIASASTNSRLDSITASMSTIMAVIDGQIKDRKVNVDTLQKVLPHFNLEVVAGDDNLINDILRPSQMSIAHLNISAANDSSLYMRSNVLEFTTSTLTLDTIALNVEQQAEKMHILATVNNTPGNMDNWAHIRLDGLLNTDRLSFRIIQQNVDKVTGFDLGAIAAVADSAVTARFFPLSPVIGYKKWSVNMDNFLYYNFFTHHIDANLKMKGDDSSLQLYTEHDHGLDHHGHEEEADSLNNVILKISDIHLSDWISFNPFAPPISGNLSASMDVNWDGGSNINGTGQVALTDFFYDRKQVASMLVDLDVKTNLAGIVRAQADVEIDGKRTMTLAGNLNEENTDSPFDLDFSMIEFPLATVNPFLPEDMAQLSGMLNGTMQISGDMDHPHINGEIDFESAYVKVAMTNTSYAFSPVKIPVKDNLVSFKDFSISGANENPLFINGTVDIADLTSPKIDLTMKANNMMVVNTQRASRNALIYGKAYLDLDASVRGNLRFMAVNAKVDVLSGTNVSYKLTESSSDLSALSNEDMVKFVNLTDTAAVAAADSISSESMLMMIDAQLNIQQGTTVTVDLFTGARDKVQLQPTGYLTYSQAPMSDGRMTGRINLNSGYVRYTLPVIGSEKMFTINDNSYVVFNGDLLNPVLNLHATDETKINVTQEGQNSRLVNFDISVGITGTLEQMDVAFDLSTDDDITVANELQSMSPQQRANQAMNMLLYNMYTGPGSSTNLNLSANPLFSFLESQINNWAANNIKGVDLSFGIDQYNNTVNGATSSAMSYSYQVSKSLFNDRFKIVVGGNYTTDANADENLAENLINDISFEYFLNRQQTMVLRLFRHVGYVSILEGEITQTGVGFVYRRKLDRLANMLPKFIRPKQKEYKPEDRNQR